MLFMTKTELIAENISLNLRKNSSCVELKNNRFKYARNNSENAM